MPSRRDATAVESQQARLALVAALQRETTAFGSARNRAALLSLTGALMILLTCGFAAVWLDARWDLSARETDALRFLLAIALASLFLGLALAVLALTRGEGPAADLNVEAPVFSDVSDRDESLRLLFGTVESSRERVESALVLIRWGSALILVGLLVIVAQGAVFSFAAGAEEDGSLGKSPAPPVNPVDRLVTDNAPAVLLHRAERYGPLDPDMFLARSALRWRRPGRDVVILPKGRVEAARIGAKCSTANSGCATFGPFMPFQLTRPHRQRARGAVKLSNGPLRLPATRGMYLEEPDLLHRGQLIAEPRVPIFFHDERSSDGALKAVTYWMFFGFTGAWRPQSARGHEGDWERFTVRFEKGRPATLVTSRNVETPWAKVEKRLGHPAVYVSLGTHTIGIKRATARSPGVRRCDQCPREPRGTGIVWRTWEGPDSVRDVRREPWFGFGGAWGHAGARASESGPLGPTSFVTNP